MTVYILMGVSGTGKSTVGHAAADALGLPFIDADDLHPPLNISKMSSGVPLTAADREDWGEAIIQSVKAAKARTENSDTLLACSALEMGFRRRLRAGLNGHVVYLHLRGDRITLKRRLATRKDHFFKPEMLASQFAALEMPHRAIDLDITLPVTKQVEIIRKLIESRKA